MNLGIPPVQLMFGNLTTVSVGTTIFSGGTTGSLLFIGPGSIVQQNNQSIFWDDVNYRFGIGTTTPGAPLHIVGNSFNTLGIIQSDDTGDSALRFRLGAAGQAYTFGIDNSDSDKFKISDGSVLGTTDRLTIDTSGNVGIGTTTPGVKLHVHSLAGVADSGAYFSDADVSHGLTGPLGADSNYFRITEYDGLAGGAYLIGAGDNASVPGLSLQGIIGTTDPTDTAPALFLNGSKKNTTVEQAMGALETVLQIETGILGSGTKLMTILGSGNVGIGTIAPVGLLHVSSDTDATGLSYFTQANASADSFDIIFRKARGTGAAPTVITTADELGVINFTGYGGAAGYITGAAIKGISSGTIADSRVPGFLSFWTGTNAAPSVLTERMRISSEGDVGIGSTIPLGKLEVKGVGGIVITQTSNAANQLIFRNEIGGNSFAFYTVTNDLRFYDTDDRFVLQFGGNIGIGQNAPTALLHLTQPVKTSGSPTELLVVGGAHTTLAASTQATDVDFNLARTVQFATGALATQRAFVIQAPTYGFVGASTITTASTLSITGAPIAGTNATLTNANALVIESGSVQHTGSANNRAKENAILYGATTDAATAVSLTFDGAAAGAGNQIKVPADTTLSVVVNISVKQSGSANAKQMLRQFVISNNGGTTAIQGTVVTLGTDSGSAGLTTVTTTITADDTNDVINIVVNGVAATNLRYTAYLISTEVLYA